MNSAVQDCEAVELAKVARFVYFVQCGKAGPIKIGSTCDVLGRAESLQASCPYRLRILATVTSDLGTEGQLHRLFSSARLHGEWFRPVPELLAWIGKRADDWKDRQPRRRGRHTRPRRVLETGSTQAYPRPVGTTDVFARLKSDEVKEFDGYVEAIVPQTSRSAVIAMLMRTWMREQREKGEK